MSSIEMSLFLAFLPLQVHQHNPGIFYGGFDGSQESDSFTAIHQTMVVGQSDVHHGADDDLSIPDNWPLEHAMHTKDGGLRRVDDWSTEKRTKDSSVADSESSTVHVLNRDVVILGLPSITSPSA
jgi:hypothetical protein